MRPEDMTTPRTAYQINASSPGSDLAAETAAAMAAASIVFKDVDASYSATLLSHAREVRVPGLHENRKAFKPNFCYCMLVSLLH
jgi:hypothetical protein